MQPITAPTITPMHSVRQTFLLDRGACGCAVFRRQSAVSGLAAAVCSAEGVGTWGFATAYFGGGIGALIGAVVAFAFIRCDSLSRPAQ